MFAFSRFLAQNANILVQPVLNLQKNWSESVFWKKRCISDGNQHLPYKTLKSRVSMFSLMFAFSRFLAQNANILVQPVLNLQKNWPESVFWKKSCISDRNHSLPYKTLKFKVSMFSIMFAFSRFWLKTQTYWSNQFLICKIFGQNKCFGRKVGFVKEIAIWRTRR